MAAMASIILLSLSVLGLWWAVDSRAHRQRLPWLSLPAVLGLALLLWSGGLAPGLGALLFALVVLMVAQLRWPTGAGLRWLVWLVPVLGVLAALQVIPGGQRISLYGEWIDVNWVKGMVSVPLLLLLYQRQGSVGWPYGGGPVEWQRWLLIAPFVPFMLLVGWAAGYAYEFKFSERTLFFLYGNLVCTVVAEEVLFRGLLQAGLMQWLQGRATGYSWIAIPLVSVLFGVAHLGGGAQYALLATLAGALYGTAYHLTGRLSGAVLTHLGVNVGHFVFLQYAS